MWRASTPAGVEVFAISTRQQFITFQIYLLKETITCFRFTLNNQSLKLVESSSLSRVSVTSIFSASLSLHNIFSGQLTFLSLEMLYYENGQLLSQPQASVPINMSLPPDASLLSVGGYYGQGGFSTMGMSDLAFWTRSLSKQEVKESYLKSEFQTRWQDDTSFKEGSVTLCLICHSV